MELLLRRSFDASDLPPAVIRHPHKQLACELAMSGPTPVGTIEVTRWRSGALPRWNEQSFRSEFEVMSGHYTYSEDPAIWHVNFADPVLFVAYGSRLLAQDELQCLEHPALGSIREALGDHAFTERDGVPTPVLVANVERRCALATARDLAAGRPYGLYGNRFAAAEPEQIRAALSLVRPPTHTNLIAIAAPTGAGEYMRAQLESIVSTAYTGFAAAVHEGAVEVRTGFWGCGAFGGNRLVMTSLQLYAAHLAGVARLRFYAFDDAGRGDALAGARVLDEALATGDVIEAIADRDFRWGVSDGT